MKSKVCKFCNTEKEINNFYKVKKSKDGYNNKCKECHKEYCKKYNLNSKDKYNSIRKEIKKKNRIEYDSKIRNMFINEKINKTITYIFILNDFIKIGKTTNLYERVAKFKTETKLSISNIFIANSDIEKRMKKECSNFLYDTGLEFKGSKKECFKLNDDVLRFLIEKENFIELL